MHSKLAYASNIKGTFNWELQYIYLHVYTYVYLYLLILHVVLPLTLSRVVVGRGVTCGARNYTTLATGSHFRILAAGTYFV